MERYRSGCLALGLLLFLCPLILLPALLYGQLQNAWRSAAWPETPGQILSSDARSTRIPFRSYAPFVRYTYTVDGQAYTGDTLAFVRDGVGAAWAGRKVAQYPPGREVMVYYDPANPAVAVLEPGATPAGLLSAFGGYGIFALILVAFGALSLRLSHDWKKRVEAAE